MTAFILSAALSIAGAGQKPDELDAKLVKAREKAFVFLKQQQTKEGHWESDALNILADMQGGMTALVTLSLLEVGVPADDEAVKKAVAYLVKLEPKKTYVVSLQTQVLARVDAKKYKEQIQRNADWLMKEAILKGDKLEGWSYPINPIPDGSNTHFAVVALHAAAQAGAKVDGKVWEQIRDLYARTQNKGWTYTFRPGGGDRPPPSASMTTCGLLGLTIAVKYDKNAKGPDPAFEKGMSALLDLESGEFSKSDAYVWLATAELGRALGVTEFKAGKKARAWYREGAEKLVKEQKDDGSWEGKQGIDKTPVYATACALYFLGPVKK
jgi:hypothetical protein